MNGRELEGETETEIEIETETGRESKCSSSILFC